MPTPVIEIRAKSANSTGPVSNPTPPAIAERVSHVPQLPREGWISLLGTRFGKTGAIVLSILAILIGLAWAFGAAKLPGMTPIAEKADTHLQKKSWASNW